jgi:hypothetical protein
MGNYYSEWKFKHPQPSDFKASIERSSGRNLDALFDELSKTGPLKPAVEKSVKLTFLYNLHETDKFNYLSLAPAVGYNNYDKAMIGGLIHNYQLPAARFHFIAGGLIGTGSQRVNGFGRVSHNTYKRNYHLETSAGYMSYSYRHFTKSDNIRVIAGVKRLVPSVKLTLFDKDPTLKRQIIVHAKSFVLREDVLNFTTVITPLDTTEAVTTLPKNSIINRLSVNIFDNRALYPYDVNLTADQGRNFIRAGLTSKYFFNYPNGKTGMSVRFFAGKFFYTTQKTINAQLQNERYFLNMSGPEGYEDYTYSEYYIGRTEFNKWMSQQIMERDGFFKVNTNRLSEKVGKTDNWLSSLNLVSDIPDNINPLKVLPVKIPVKIFADFGTYSEAWRDNPATGRFIFDAGFQFSLLGSVINIYVPLLFSRVYSNYYKSTLSENRFARTLSFNIDLSQLQLKKLFGDIPL